MLLRRWERARQGDGQLVLIVGEPGLGKSRLIEEFHARLRETPHTWVEWSCSQLLQNRLLFSVLYGFWAANYVAFNGDALRYLRGISGSRREARGDSPARLLASRHGHILGAHR